MEGKKNIRMVVRYDGTRYHGWQRQREEPTIQGLLEDKIGIIIGDPVTLIGAGRTDAGVHALHQVCHFLTESTIDPPSLCRGLNSLLSSDIRIRSVEYAPLDFHARYSAKSKTYEYRILNCREPDPFLRFYTWHVPSPLELSEIERCLPILSGKHDFSSFMSSGSKTRDPVREMMRAELHRSGDGLVVLVFEADGFLRHMVRNIVGTLVEVGKKRWDSEHFLRIFQAGDRCATGVKAPAQGLFLKMVSYGLA
jgi:tRNA pseudouridine38-40 synthase